MFHKVLYRSLTQKIHLIQRNLKGSDPSGLEKKIRQGFLLQTPRSIIFRALNGGARTTIHTTRIKDTLGVISPATAILNAYKYVVGERSLCAKCARAVNVVFVMQAGGMLSWRGSFGRLRFGDIHVMQ